MILLSLKSASQMFPAFLSRAKPYGWLRLWAVVIHSERTGSRLQLSKLVTHGVAKPNVTLSVNQDAVRVRCLLGVYARSFLQLPHSSRAISPSLVSVNQGSPLESTGRHGSRQPASKEPVETIPLGEDANRYTGDTFQKFLAIGITSSGHPAVFHEPQGQRNFN